MGYDIDDKAALNIFSDMADILANGLLNNSLMYPTASFTVCSPNGTAIATSMLTVMGENNILGLPLCFFGEYEYLNDTEATQRVQSAWNSKSE